MTYFALSTIYVLLFAIAGRFYKKKNYGLKSDNSKASIAVFIPAYKEDAIMLPIAKQLLLSDYPENLFDLIVIADSFKRQTIISLKELPIKVVEVSWVKSTKAKSLNYALNLFDGKYDIAVISDADNILEKRFLNKINAVYQNGANAIQGCRVAKNLSTPFSILDAASEAINNHVFRKGANALGLSSALIGSGMAFQYKMLKDFLNKIDAVGGFDKELQLEIIEKGHNISYIDDAIVYDEKIENSTSFGNQRKRWLSTQFIYLRKSFYKGLIELKKGNFSYFNLSILVNVFLSRVLTLGSLIVLTLGYFLFDINILFKFYLLLLCIYCFALLISLPKRMYNKRTFFALLRLPKAFYIMLLSLLKIKGANKDFIHTTHTNTSIDNSALL
ncbi:glycosyltransferase [Chondrinema litorale]|uniref:glycosyltransferase n=1 Tax=Chondrinema litorale TaxID=2994555 RepID=UPI0025426EE3|nr:glycosyltransferase family 2 protein [Chondrinema litorale]UZS00110.1 glycosyltransferase family 2 protein [Chondrinema litorale]